MSKLIIYQLDGVTSALLTDVFQMAMTNPETKPKEKADFLRLSLDLQNQRNENLNVFITSFNRAKIVKAIKDGVMYNRDNGRLGLAEFYLSIAKDIDK